MSFEALCECSANEEIEDTAESLEEFRGKATLAILCSYFPMDSLDLGELGGVKFG